MRLHYTETQRLLIAVATLWAIMLLGGDCGRDKPPGLDAADSAAVSTLNTSLPAASGEPETGFISGDPSITVSQDTLERQRRSVAPVGSATSSLERRSMGREGKPTEEGGQNDSREQTGTTSAAEFLVLLSAVNSCRVSNGEDSRPPSEIAWITMLGQGWPVAVSPMQVEGLRFSRESAGGNDGTEHGCVDDRERGGLRIPERLFARVVIREQETGEVRGGRAGKLRASNGRSMPARVRVGRQDGLGATGNGAGALLEQDIKHFLCAGEAAMTGAEFSEAVRKVVSDLPIPQHWQWYAKDYDLLRDALAFGIRHERRDLEFCDFIAVIDIDDLLSGQLLPELIATKAQQLLADIHSAALAMEAWNE